MAVPMEVDYKIDDLLANSPSIENDEAISRCLKNMILKNTELELPLFVNSSHFPNWKYMFSENELKFTKIKVPFIFELCPLLCRLVETTSYLIELDLSRKYLL